MKKLSLFSALILAVGLKAQTADDVELFNMHNLRGTPRFTAMGGAFTALGNDASAIRLNPAGAAVDLRSSINFATGFQTRQNQLGPFYGQNQQTDDFDLSFESFGLNLNFDVSKTNRFSFAIAVNKRADFQRNFSITGAELNDYTLGEYWAESSIGLDVDQISDDAFAAWDAFILVPDSNGLFSADGYAYGQVIDGNLVSNGVTRYTINQNGSFNETDLTFAADRHGKLYYGLSLGFPTLNFRREEFIDEFNLNNSNAPYSANSYTFRRLNDIYANGFNLKAGLIYRPIQEIRFGLSYQTNSWFTIEQFYETDVIASFDEEPEPGVGRNTASRILTTDLYSYRLRTPAVLRAGFATVIAKQLILSFDYQLERGQNQRLYTSFSSFNIDETVLQTEFQPVVENLFRENRATYAAGLEWKIKSFFLRGGYRLQESIYDPSVEDITLGSRQDLSAGIGFRTGGWSFNVSAVQSTWNRTMPVYRGVDENGAGIAVLQDLDNTINQLNIIVGAQYRF